MPVSPKLGAKKFFTHAAVQTKDYEIRKLTWDGSPLPTIHVQISFMLGVNTICQKKRRIIVLEKYLAHANDFMALFTMGLRFNFKVPEQTQSSSPIRRKISPPCGF